MHYALLLFAMLHPVHETVSEVQWNGETKRFEVALRLHLLDQQWIEKRSGSSQAVEHWGVNYLERTFLIRPQTKAKSQPPGDPTGNKATIHWVGRSDEGSHVWWYFEVEPVTANQTPARYEIQQQMFFERNEAFRNRVILIGQLSKTAITLTIERPIAPLEESIDEHPSLPPENAGSVEVIGRSDFDRR
ncbi:hypothetical protein Pla52o_20980 [Novipirellula galeiformis]|uniref:Uncharacterized protein n=1 Tax=Novipirellula galeiformis TaxID=2528004 RepID=A0A5C6CL61_9BACT|nr:hypothetical protein Pla52o_20980 [Novipirellula galeiformis]